MLIRCEKCSTLYELDEKLLPPQGAPVQCSKCQFVFKAYPPAEQPAGAADEPARAPAMGAVVEPDAAVDEPLPPPDDVPPAPREPAPRAVRGDDLVRESGALAGNRGAPGMLRGEPPPIPAGEEPRFTADGRPIRKVPFPTTDAASPGVRPTATRQPPVRNGGRLDAAAIMRWVVVVVVLVAIAIGAALAWRTYHRRASARIPAGQSPADAQGGTATPQPRK